MLERLTYWIIHFINLLVTRGGDNHNLESYLTVNHSGRQARHTSKCIVCRRNWASSTWSSRKAIHSVCSAAAVRTSAFRALMAPMQVLSSAAKQRCPSAITIHALQQQYTATIIHCRCLRTATAIHKNNSRLQIPRSFGALPLLLLSPWVKQSPASPQQAEQQNLGALQTLATPPKEIHT